MTLGGKLRGLVPRLPGRAWAILGGDALSAAGSGLTLPFLFVYLHRVRGIDLQVTGVAAAAIAVASFAGNPAGGSLSDRIGSRRTLMLGLVCSGLGAAQLMAVHHAWQAIVATATLGFGNSVSWPAQDALLATVVSDEARSDVFSVRHATLNAGFGVGMLAAAALADISRPSSFVLLYAIDAATFWAFIPVLAALRGAGQRPAVPAAGEGEAPSGGYRAILRDRAFLRLWVLTALLITVGYGMLNGALPAFAARPGGISAHGVALAAAANTVAVVAAQLVVLQLVRGKRRTRALVGTAVIWAASWGMVLGAGRLGGSLAAIGAFAGAEAVFGLGETLLGPSLRPLVNDLAPDQLRGRYNGAATLAWTTGFMAGPLIAGFALAAGRPGALFIGLIAACAVGAVLALRLEHTLDPDINRIPTPAGDDTDTEVSAADLDAAAPVPLLAPAPAE